MSSATFSTMALFCSEYANHVLGRDPRCVGDLRHGRGVEPLRRQQGQRDVDGILTGLVVHDRKVSLPLVAI